MDSKELTRKRLIAVVYLVICLVLTSPYCFGEQLSKEEIIQAATAQAEELGYLLEDMEMVYDQGHEELDQYFMRGEVSVYDEKTKQWTSEQLTGPEEELLILEVIDYQAVYFAPKRSASCGDLWVFIDKDTGELAGYIKGGDR